MMSLKSKRELLEAMEPQYLKASKVGRQVGTNRRKPLAIGSWIYPLTGDLTQERS